MKIEELKYADKFNNMTLRCCMVLLALREGDSDFSVLAAKLGLPKPALSRASDALWIAGLAKRTRNEKDHRMVTVRLTDDGKKAAEAIHG